MTEAIALFGAVCGIFALLMAAWAVISEFASEQSYNEGNRITLKALVAGATVGAVLYFGCIVLLLGQAITTVVNH